MTIRTLPPTLSPHDGCSARILTAFVRFDTIAKSASKFRCTGVIPGKRAAGDCDQQGGRALGLKPVIDLFANPVRSCGFDDELFAAVYESGYGTPLRRKPSTTPHKSPPPPTENAITSGRQPVRATSSIMLACPSHSN
jgi:hypothetical protein